MACVERELVFTPFIHCLMVCTLSYLATYVYEVQSINNLLNDKARQEIATLHAITLVTRCVASNAKRL